MAGTPVNWHMLSTDTAATPQAPAAPTASAPPRARPRFDTFGSLRHPNYRLLWIGTLCMSAGQWIQQVTLGYLAYELTGSAAVLGALGAVRTLPFLLVSPLAGVVADRVDRRILLIRAQWFLVVTAVLMGVLVVSGALEVWHLFVFTLVTGTAWSFNQPARMALVPDSVPKEDLMNATALNSLGFNITKVIGPALGGVLIAAFGAGGNFFVQAVAYLGVTLAIYFMKMPASTTVANNESVLENLKGGIAYAWQTPMVLALLALTLIPALLAIPYMALMPVFAKDVLGEGPASLGAMYSAPGLGAVVSTLCLASFANRLEKRGPLLLGALVLLGILLMLFSRTTSLPIALVALVGVGAFHILYMSVANTTLQVIVPDALRGRVMSLYMLDIGLTPFGTLLAGVSTQAFGAPTTLTIMGASVIILAVVVAWRLPQVRRITT